MGDETKTGPGTVNEHEDRGKWGGQIEFLLSCIGYCVGLGNVWRFPYLCYRNGGGAFLIPYVIMLCLAGIPLFLMELTLGQFSGLGPVSAWRASPAFKGIGVGMIAVSALVSIYYNMVIAYALFYLFASFQSVLPWTLTCEDWNTDAVCQQSLGNDTFANSTTASPDYTTTLGVNQTINSTDAPKRVSPSEEYWKYRVLRMDRSTGIDDPGEVLWDLCLCLLLAWIVVFVCLAKGVKSSGKVVYFTATFPYLILIILFFRGVTLEGAGDGIYFYIVPKWELLSDAKVWKDAATQIFYSLGIGFGGLLTFASYNKFNNNLFRDTLIVTLGNCCTSVFAGFVIFSIIGNMAFRLGLDVEDVASEGPGLTFIAYPEAVSLLPLPQLWSVLFFIMLFLLGIDSQFATIETVVTGISDEFPNFFRTRKIHLMIAVCVTGFLLGLLLVTEGGIYWFNLYEWYSSFYGLLILAFVLCVTLNWGYGYFFTTRWRFNRDIELMLGSTPNIYFRLGWMGVTPAMILFITIYSAVYHAPISYDGYIYPQWAENLGLCMTFTCAAAIPICMVYKMIGAYLKGESIKELFKPSPKWGPSDKSVAYDNAIGYVPDNARTIDFENRGVYSMKVDDDIPDAYTSI